MPLEYAGRRKPNKRDRKRMLEFGDFDDDADHRLGDPGVDEADKEALFGTRRPFG